MIHIKKKIFIKKNCKRKIRLGRELYFFDMQSFFFFDMQSSELLLRNETFWGTSPAVQWLRLPASSAGSMGLISGRGTKTPHALP